MGRKVIRGVARRYHTPSSSSRGYRAVWDSGPASYRNRIKKLTGINRPST